MKKTITITLAAAIIASAFSLSACGNNNAKTSSSQNTTTQSSLQSVEEISVEPSKTELTSSQLSQMEASLAGYKSIPKFVCKSAEIDAEKISSNATISFIPDNSSDEFSSLVTKQFASAADSAGFKKVSKAKTDGTPATINDALTSTVTNKNNIAVMFGSINKDNVSAQIEKTQANGIKIVSGGNAGIDETEHFVDNTVPINYQLAGKILADWSIVKQKGKVNALAVNCSDSGSSTSAYRGFADEFKKYVVSGYCTTLNVATVDIGNGLVSKIKDALTKDPNLNYIIVFDDSLIDDTISAAEQAGVSAKIIATGGAPKAFDSTQSGKIEMLVAQSYEWTAYAMVDYTLRVMAKTDLPKEQDVPVRIVTSDSIKSELSKNDDDIDGYYEICFGSAFVEGYSNLWKL